MMYKMKNKEGNVYKTIADIHKKELLESLGYTVIDDDGEDIVSATEVDDESDGANDNVDPFEKMTIPKLKEYAKQNGIDITSTIKEDIIAEIKKSLEADNTAGDTELE